MYDFAYHFKIYIKNASPHHEASLETCLSGDVNYVPIFDMNLFLLQ